MLSYDEAARYNTTRCIISVNIYRISLYFRTTTPCRFFTRFNQTKYLTRSAICKQLHRIITTTGEGGVVCCFTCRESWNGPRNLCNNGDERRTI